MPFHGDRYLIDQEGASSSCIGFSLPERRPRSAFISGSDKISEALVVHSHWPPQEHLLFIPHGPHICLPLLFVIPVWPGGYPGIIDSKGNLTRLDTRNSAGHMICVTRGSPVTLSEPQFLSLHGEISIPTWTATVYSTGGLPWEHPQY